MVDAANELAKIPFEAGDNQLTLLMQQIDEVYDLLAIKQHEYLVLEGELFDAKFNLSRSVDAAYDAGGVLGKNEREREANLRQVLADLYDVVDDTERKLRVAQRGLRDAEIAAERLRLKIALLTSRQILQSP